MNHSSRSKFKLTCVVLFASLLATACAGTTTAVTTQVTAAGDTETASGSETASVDQATPAPVATATSDAAADDAETVLVNEPASENELVPVPRETSAPVPEGSVLSCIEDFDTILDVTTAGIPLFSYDRVETLDGLLGRTGAVITADLISLRPVGQGGALMAFDRIEVLAGTSSLAPSAEFLSNSLFPHREEPQLSDPIAVEGVEVMVFIDEFDFARYGVVADIQGLAFQCSSGSAQPVIQSFPQQLQDLTISDIAALIAAS